MEIIKQNKDEIRIMMDNGEEITVQNNFDSIILSAMPPKKVIDIRQITTIYAVIGVINTEDITQAIPLEVVQ